VPTLYVENVPEDLYEALRQRAKAENKSISAEVISLLRTNIPTPEVMERRMKLIEKMRRLQARKSPRPGPLSSAVEMLREDRER
jgi:plasmid stability protein